MLQAGRSRVWFPMKLLEFSIDLILLAAIQPWGRLRYLPRRVQGGRRVRLTPSPSNVSWLSRICGILEVSKHYGPPWSLTRIGSPSSYVITSLLLSIFSSFTPPPPHPLPCTCHSFSCSYNNHPPYLQQSVRMAKVKLCYSWLYAKRTNMFFWS
jgi:hypothetical protein